MNSRQENLWTVPPEVMKLAKSLQMSSRARSKATKSEELFWFVAKHLNLFCDNVKEAKAYVDMLVNKGDMSVDSIADMLNIPEYVFFKKYSALDIRKMLVNFQKSAVWDDFMNGVDKTKNGQIVLFMVSGESSYVATNMQTDYVEGRMHLFFKSIGELPDIHIFHYKDAPLRMGMFRQGD